jgi:hypothetical protein
MPRLTPAGACRADWRSSGQPCGVVRSGVDLGKERHAGFVEHPASGELPAIPEGLAQRLLEHIDEVLVIDLASGICRHVPRIMTMVAVWEEVGTPGSCATDTSASSAIALTRASLEGVASTSAATEVSLASLTGVVSTSAAIEVTRFSAISGHDLRPDLQGVHPV